MLKKIISGGQTGVDIAALKAAQAVGLETGGFMPSGFYTEAGFKPEYEALYGMEELPPRKLLADAYRERTRKNVEASDATLLIGTNLNSPGSRAMQKAASKATKQVYGIRWNTAPRDDDDLEHTWGGMITGRAFETLNIAGNRDTVLEEPVEAFLTEVFRRVIHAQKRNTVWEAAVCKCGGIILFLGIHYYRKTEPRCVYDKDGKPSYHDFRSTVRIEGGRCQQCDKWFQEDAERGWDCPVEVE